MKTKTRTILESRIVQIGTNLIWISVLAVMVCVAEVSQATPMGTAFTYQGHLYDNNSVADDLYDFQFKLFDDSNVILGNQIGTEINQPEIDVTSGYFTVKLDFGVSVFNGDARWLEIGVRPGYLSDPNVYTTLSPRQEVTPAPYSIYSKNSAGLILPYAGSASTTGVVFSIANDIAGTAISGNATATSVVNLGLEGISDSTKGVGVAGENNYYNTHGSLGSTIYGVYGRDNSSGNFGYIGSNMYGIYGENDSSGNYGYLGSNAYGVYGYGLQSGAYGVYGRVVASDGIGVYGEHWASSGTDPGVYGVSNSTGSDATGILGEISSTSPGSYSAGVRGINRGTGGLGIGVWGSQDGSGWGVYGTSVDGRGIFGSVSGSDGVAVYGSATNSGSATNYGGYFTASGTYGRGAYGYASGSDGRGLYGETPGYNGYGVEGRATGEQGRGVFGYASGSSGVAVEGSAGNNGLVTNYGGYFVAAGTYGRGCYGYASGSDGRGLYGETPGYNGYGVEGRATGGQGRGVFGYASGSNGVAVEGSASNIGGYFVASGASGKGVYGWGNAYDFYAAGPGTNYGTASSVRWKSNIRPIDEPLEKVLRLRGVYFNWDTRHGGSEDIGMIAEEVGQVLPEIVQYEQNRKYATGMDYSKLTPLLVEAVKALQSEVDNLKDDYNDKEETIQLLKEENQLLKKHLASIEEKLAKISGLPGGRQL